MVKFFADFHIHSKYSYATSKYLDLEELAYFGQLKGLGLMGTGDFTHPVWRKQLTEQLVSAEPGLFCLGPALQEKMSKRVYASCRSQLRFIITSEVCTIFKRNGHLYKMHLLVVVSSWYAAEKISDKLGRIGSIIYDGRPIIKIDAQDLVHLILELSPDAIIVPAHIFAPHFGLLSAHHGFDFLQDCFGDMIDYIYAIEKGLSASFSMTARLSQLDKFAILANSDAHSAENLGREANLFDTQLSYQHIAQALITRDSTQLIAGIEFFPQMGKYYNSGHRHCQMNVTGKDSLIDSICLQCHKKMTLGVAHRVEQLADRTVKQAVAYTKKSYSIVPLTEIIAYVVGCSVSAKKCKKIYLHLIGSLGSEFFILLDADPIQIANYSNVAIAQAIMSIRQGNISFISGYDGRYGSILLPQSSQNE